MKSMSIYRLLIVFIAVALGSLFPTRADSVGPASKRTALIISEVMYHPAARADGKNLEFIELYNSENVPIDVSTYRIDGDVSYTFPTNTTIPGLGYFVVAAAPADLQSVYGLTGG